MKESYKMQTLCEYKRLGLRMNIQMSGRYKSFLKETQFPDMPDFVVLAGENGAGKSQFINGIAEGAIVINDVGSQPIGADKIIKHDSVSLQQDSYTAADNASHAHQIYQNYINGGGGQHLINDEYIALSTIIQRIKADLNTEKIDIDTIRTWLRGFAYQSLPFQTIQLLNIFSGYYTNLANNLIAKSAGEEHLADEAFECLFGKKPWEVLNHILHEQAKLHFKFSAPREYNPSDISLVLCKNSLGAQFPISDLSSGEKVLLTLALSLFSAERKALRIPKIILLDEVDCHLHPSMIQNLLYLVEEVFVKQYRIKVIMTTHSPTTVALANESAIYYMTPDNENRVCRISKDAALKKLAYGIPTLAVAFQNRINVITESHYDALNLSGIYTILSNTGHLNGDMSLAFISSGSSSAANSGSCNNVYDLVTKFDTSNTHGIVDWDKQNECRKRVHVLAHGERYSIENCILDPIALSLLLLNEVSPKFNPAQLGLSQSFALSRDITDFFAEAQHITDAFITSLRHPVDTTTDSRRKVEYAGGLTVEMPEDFLQFQGHALEDAIKEAYPTLRRFHNVNDLKAAVVVIFQRYPEVIPCCFLEIFRDIIGDAADAPMA